ncbi:hypothetical protein BAUCODRAFT_426119 [Baudoinia panamericana UAMH 10762]|uniref:Uncharacterized protein n=1 Tax=Baudoinia panamericana (strain UAMH 10762) TaxID=717646 RepID=M2LUZ6_BAUPA|nr:uncharacterized protein BAUCODRAFT_426119 [Baudoinia panamericana UAMH 10762]EMC98437.1 hypothetical protein BAUCODRAFT_426119 [Baudoinia panamericana UAMH 10762]
MWCRNTVSTLLCDRTRPLGVRCNVKALSTPSLCHAKMNSTFLPFFARQVSVGNSEGLM